MKNKVVSRQPCPECRKEGGDRKGDNLLIYEDGGGFCFVCRFTLKKGKQRYVREDMVRENKDISYISGYSSGAIPSRKIRKEICEEYGVKVAVDEATGDPAEVYYPYYWDSDEPVAYKVRKLNEKRFHCVGDMSKNKLFGQKLFEGSGRKMLVVVEGQDDALAMRQLLKDCGKDYAVVSVHSATTELDRYILDNTDFLVGFQTICLALDNDKAGQTMTTLLADYLVSECKVVTLNYPDGIKDCNDFLLKNREDEFEHFFFKSGKQYYPKEIIIANEISLDKLKEPRKKGFELPYPQIQNKLGGFREGELVLVAAGSGSGKTTWLKQVIFYWLDKYTDLKVGGVFLEDSVENVLQSFIAIDNKIPASRLAERPDSISSDQWEQSYNKYVKTDRITLVNSQLSQTSDSLLNKVKYLAKARGCKIIIIDNMLAALAGNKEGDERRNIDAFVESLSKIAVEKQVCIILVNHLKRTQGKNIHEGDAIELTDLRGSGSLEALASTVVAIERDQQADDDFKKNLVRLRVLKARATGRTGVADTLMYDTKTGLLNLEKEY